MDLLRWIGRLRRHPPRAPLWRWRGRDGSARGPEELVRLHAMLADGRLDGQTLVAPEGSEHWQPLSTLLRRDG